MKCCYCFIVLILIGIISFGCSNSDESSVSNDSGSDKAETSFNFTMSSFLKQETAGSSERQASFTVDQIMTGQLTATNTDDSSVQTFDWSIYLDEETFDVQSNKTIILAPGTYDFSLLLTKGDQQYAGTALGQAISDGTFDVPMTIRPVIGETVTDVSVVASLADLKFQYDPAELTAASLSVPQLGIVVDGGTEQVFAINTGTGITDDYINLTQGTHTIQIALYDGSLQKGRSISAQETVVVSAGTNITMDLVALHGETTFALTEDGGDATFSFNIPAEVVDEAGGADNLDVLFAMEGDKNTLEENLLTVEEDGSGGYESSIILTGKQFDNITVSLTFTEISSSEQLGSCATATVLNTTERTINCDVTLRRRAIIGGSLLATLGVNVFNEAGEPVAGASVYKGGVLIGLTNSGAFGTEGYLQVYVNADSYTVSADEGGMYGETLISLSALTITNIDITLDQDSSQLETKLPDTGQTTCYDGAGAIIACPEPGSALAQDGSYSGIPKSYNDNENGTITDNITRLIWQKEDDNIQRNWSDANSYCQNLSLAGYTDWHLPSPMDLGSIVDFEPSYTSGIARINQTYFPNTNLASYWSEAYVRNTNMAWNVNFQTARMFSGSGINLLYYVRCVRSPDSSSI